MSVSEEYLEFVADLLAGMPRLQLRRMFGGAGVYADGRMFALIADNELYLRIADLDRQDFVDAGSEPFRYEGRTGRRTMKSYWRVPADWFDRPGYILATAQRALATTPPATPK